MANTNSNIVTPFYIGLQGTSIVINVTRFWHKVGLHLENISLQKIREMEVIDKKRTTELERLIEQQDRAKRAKNGGIPDK